MKNVLRLLLFALSSPLFADCLAVTRPGQIVNGGTYSCILVARGATGARIENATVENAPGQGIEILADSVTVTNVTVTGAAANGLLVGCGWKDGACSFIPRGIVIDGGLYTKSAYNGIMWDGCASCVIRGARVSYNRTSGILIGNVGDGPFDIHDNQIDHNGLDILPGERWRGHGIYTGEPGKLYHNRINSNGGYGFHAWPGLSPRTTPQMPLDIRYNRIYGNGDGGTYIGSGNPGALHYWHNAEYGNGDEELLP